MVGGVLRAWKREAGLLLEPLGCLERVPSSGEEEGLGSLWANIGFKIIHISDMLVLKIYIMLKRMELDVPFSPVLYNNLRTLATFGKNYKTNIPH